MKVITVSLQAGWSLWSDWSRWIMNEEELGNGNFSKILPPLSNFSRGALYLDPLTTCNLYSSHLSQSFLCTIAGLMTEGNNSWSGICIKSEIDFTLAFVLEIPVKVIVETVYSLEVLCKNITFVLKASLDQFFGSLNKAICKSARPLALQKFEVDKDRWKPQRSAKFLKVSHFWHQVI